MGLSEIDNRIVWDRAPGHYEVWYLTFTDPGSGYGFWIRYTIEAPTHRKRAPFGRVWFAAFPPEGPPVEAFMLDVSLDRVSALDDPFQLAMANASLRHGRAQGELPNGVSWDLHWQPPVETHHHLPPWAYRVPITSTRVLSPAANIRVHGTVCLADREISVQAAPGGQTHLWGSRHAESWAWASVAAWDGGEDAWLEATCGRVRRGGRTLPPMTILSLRWCGETHHFRGLKQAIKTESEFGIGEWDFAATGTRLRVEGAVRHPAQRLLLAHYHDPDGTSSYCHNSEVASATVRIWTRTGRLGRWGEPAQLVASGTAHAEWGQRTPAPAVEHTFLSL